MAPQLLCHCEEGQRPDVAIPFVCRTARFGEIATPVYALARNDRSKGHTRTIFLIIQKNPVVVNCMFSAFCGKTLFVLRQKPPKAAKFEKNLPKTLAEIGKSVYSLTAYEKNYL